jgi:hypothetical protein
VSRSSRLGVITLAFLVLSPLLCPSPANGQPVPTAAERDFGIFKVTANVVRVAVPGWSNERVDLDVHAKWTTGEDVHFRIEDFGFGVLPSNFRFFSDRRLLILGSGKFGDVAIVDPWTGEIIDHPEGCRVEVSPDARYLAIDRDCPNGQAWTDTVYLIYDVARSPAENRLQPSSMDGGRRSFGLGIPVYPPENATSQKLHLALTEADAHQRAAGIGLRWASATQLVFVDYFQGKNYLAVVDLRDGPREARSYRVTLDQTLDPELRSISDGMSLQINDIQVVSANREAIVVSLSGLSVWPRTQLPLSLAVRIPLR